MQTEPDSLMTGPSVVYSSHAAVALDPPTTHMHPSDHTCKWLPAALVGLDHDESTTCNDLLLLLLLLLQTCAFVEGHGNLTRPAACQLVEVQVNSRESKQASLQIHVSALQMPGSARPAGAGQQSVTGSRARALSRILACHVFFFSTGVDVQVNVSKGRLTNSS